MKHKKDNNFRQRLEKFLYNLCVTGITINYEKKQRKIINLVNFKRKHKAK